MKILILLFFFFNVNISFAQNKYFLLNTQYNLQIELNINYKTKTFTLLDTIGHLQCYHKGRILDNKLVFDTCYFQFYESQPAVARINTKIEDKNSFLHKLYFNTPDNIKFLKSRNEICIENNTFFKNNSWNILAFNFKFLLPILYKDDSFQEFISNYNNKIIIRDLYHHWNYSETFIFDSTIFIHGKFSSLRCFIYLKNNYINFLMYDYIKDYYYGYEATLKIKRNRIVIESSKMEKSYYQIPTLSK